MMCNCACRTNGTGALLDKTSRWEVYMLRAGSERPRGWFHSERISHGWTPLSGIDWISVGTLLWLAGLGALMLFVVIR
jgi:hypothetical protein